VAGQGGEGESGEHGGGENGRLREHVRSSGFVEQVD
jgi:hypothetical protein